MSTTQQPALARALVWVYSAAVIRLLWPVWLLPLMASRLGPQEFGRLSLWLVWAVLLSVPVEGGFGAAASRLVVQATAHERADLVRQVFSARCAWSLVMAAMSVVAAWLLNANPVEATLLTGLTLATGWPATWYLQGSGQLHRWAAIELAVQLVALTAAMLWAHSVGAYLGVVTAAACVQAALGWHLVARASPAASPWWSAQACRRGLKLGASMLPVALAGAAYTSALPALASVRVSSSELGLYYLADRWVRAGLMAADPLAQLLYPRLVEQFKQSGVAAFAFATRWACTGLLVGLGALLVLYWGWPWLSAQLPHGIEASALRDVLLINAWLLPLLLAWKPLGLWMLGSTRFDSAYRLCMIGGAVAGIGAVAAVPALNATALAQIALGVEVLVIALAVVGIVWRLRWASTSTT
jgi:O-antigen/teichoic acid export membrane protein